MVIRGQAHETSVEKDSIGVSYPSDTPGLASALVESFLKVIKMKVVKVYNNNVVSVLNEQKQELIVTGRGIGFQKKRGDELEEEKIDKVFSLKDRAVSEKFKSLLYEVPMEYMEVTEEIISYAKEKLAKDLNDSIYISLTDHINFALERFQNGITISHGLLWELRRLYKEEFAIGMEALRIIKDRLGIELPEDEAGFITTHIINAELNEGMPNISNITKVVHDLLNIVRYHFKMEYDEDSLTFFRFVTHLKFFAQRLLSGTSLNSKDDFLLQIVKENHSEAYDCTLKIGEFLKAQYHYELTKEEQLYLTIHIERVVNRK